jgi:serine/threonine protein kinase
MCCLQPPFNGSNIAALAIQIVSGRYAPFPIKGYSPELERLVSQMLTVDVTKRISVEQILSSPIVARQLGTLKASPDYQNEFSASMMNEQAVLNKF